MPDLPPYTPLKLPDDVKATINSALESGSPMLIAAVSAEGKPVLSFRGSLQVYGDTQLGFWLRGVEGRTVAAIRANPNVALMYRSAETRGMYQFQGRARIATDEAERARVFEAAPEIERKSDPERKGLAIVIDLDVVEGFAGFGADGPQDVVRMAREAG
jgi:general stress protein 26